MISVKRFGSSAIMVAALLASAHADEPIPIGVSSTLTGEASTYGQDIKNVVLFANEQIGNGRFQLVIEDDKCSAKEAVSVAKKFVEIDKVKGVIGYGCSGALLAAAPIYERARIAAIGTEASAEKISDAGQYIFRTQPSDGAGAALLYDYIKSRHKIFGLLSVETEFCQGLVSALNRLAANGPLTLESENLLSSDIDPKPALLRLRGRGIDGLLLNAQDEAGAHQMLRRAKELGIDVPFYTFYVGASASFLQLAGADAEGVITVDVPSLAKIANPEGKKLFKAFVAKYGPMKAWDYGFATTFEAFRALTAALTSGEEPRSYLAKTEFNGIFGDYSFDENGDIVGLSLVLKQNRDGVPELLP